MICRSGKIKSIIRHKNNIHICANKTKEYQNKKQVLSVLFTHNNYNNTIYYYLFINGMCKH